MRQPLDLGPLAGSKGLIAASSLRAAWEGSGANEGFPSAAEISYPLSG